jgi:hypothetical protein
MMLSCKAMRGVARRCSARRCVVMRSVALCRSAGKRAETPYPSDWAVSSRSKLGESRKYRNPHEMTHGYLHRHDRSTFGWFSLTSINYFHETRFRIDLDQHKTLLEGKLMSLPWLALVHFLLAAFCRHQGLWQVPTVFAQTAKVGRPSIDRTHYR